MCEREKEGEGVIVRDRERVCVRCRDTVCERQREKPSGGLPWSRPPPPRAPEAPALGSESERQRERVCEREKEGVGVRYKKRESV